jgi:hypothetical protein
MPPAPDATGPASLILAAVVFAAAVFLGYRQWRDIRVRPDGLTPGDEGHFARQDIRRALGTIVLLILAVALAIGGRMPPKVNGVANEKFVLLWSGVILLMLVLVVLAGLDWISTRLYWRRHRQKLTDEGLSIMEAEIRARHALRRARLREDRPNGHHDAEGG